MGHVLVFHAGPLYRGEIWVMYWSSMRVPCTEVRSGSCIGLQRGSLVQG